MPAPSPQDFRDDVVRAARTRKDGVTLARIAKDFGTHEKTLSKWMRQTGIEDGHRTDITREKSAELREARNWIRLLEQKNEVLGRAAAYLSQATSSRPSRARGQCGEGKSWRFSSQR